MWRAIRNSKKNKPSANFSVESITWVVYHVFWPLEVLVLTRSFTLM